MRAKRLSRAARMRGLSIGEVDEKASNQVLGTICKSQTLTSQCEGDTLKPKKKKS